jgi:hypothetical protein
MNRLPKYLNAGVANNEDRRPQKILLIERVASLMLAT